MFMLDRTMTNFVRSSSKAYACLMPDIIKSILNVLSVSKVSEATKFCYHYKQDMKIKLNNRITFSAE